MSGSAVYLYGNVGPDYGSATISVNDQVVESSINLTVSHLSPSIVDLMVVPLAYAVRVVVVPHRAGPVGLDRSLDDQPG
jgi:hypothetical protein